MAFYISSIIITVLLLIAMITHVLKYNGFDRHQKRLFTLTFLAIIFCSLAECAVHCGYYNKALSVPLTILTVLQFSISPLLGVLFVAALGMKRQKKILVVFLIINLLVEIICAPFGAIFKFTDDGYVRGKFFLIYGATYLISLVYLLVCLVFIGRNFKNRDIGTIIMTIIVIISGIFPMTFYNVNITYMAIAIASSLCYIYYNDLVQQDIKLELVNNQEKISQMQTHMISGLANLIENRDLETGEHIIRTSYYVKHLAELCVKEGVYKDELTEDYIHLIYTLAPMHDIGKIMVSDVILRKPGKLNKEEFEEMKKHTKVGGRIVEEVLNGVASDDYIKVGSNIAKYHHEKWNGMGYPEGLKEKEIPLSARIMAIADVFDALISKRCYKEAYSYEEAFKIIEESKGTHFDPLLVDVFIKYKEEFMNQ